MEADRVAPRRAGGGSGCARVAGVEARGRRAAAAVRGRDAGRALAQALAQAARRDRRRRRRSRRTRGSSSWPWRSRPSAPTSRTRSARRHPTPGSPPGSTPSTAQIEQLAGSSDLQASLAAKLDDVERRLPSDIVTLEDLSQALAGVRDELAPSSGPAPADPRIEQLLEEVASLRLDRAPGRAGRRAWCWSSSPVRAEPDPRHRWRRRTRSRAGPSTRGIWPRGSSRSPPIPACRPRSPPGCEDLESRLPAAVVTPEDLAQALAQARAELTPGDADRPGPADRRSSPPELVALRARARARRPRRGVRSRAPTSEIGTLDAKLAAVEARLAEASPSRARTSRARSTSCAPSWRPSRRRRRPTRASWSAPCRS